MDHLDLPALAGARGSVRLPGSKSISNRILLLSALASGTTLVKGLLDSDDTRVMLDALNRLGVNWQRVADTDDYRVEGVDGRFPVRYANLFLGNAGTAFRSLTAACAFAQGDYTLSGGPRTPERPIGDLVDALPQAGAEIDYTGNEGFPPLHILAPEPTGTEIAVKGDVSSQFLTGLLLAAPLLGREVSIRVVGELISKPYVEITLNLMRRFGIDVARNGWARFTVPAVSYRSPGEIRVEGDASSASYFLAAGALGHGPVRVQGVGRDSIQGDVRFTEALAAMGAAVDAGPDWLECRRGPAGLKAIELDCNHIPDAAMTLAVLALFADGPSTLRNIASWRGQEYYGLAPIAPLHRAAGATVRRCCRACWTWRIRR